MGSGISKILRIGSICSVLIWLGVFCGGFCGFAQPVFQTEVRSNLIKSLQVKQEGVLLADPFIELNGDQRLEISFDALQHTQGRFAYSIIHCDADWKQSSLQPIEFMDGFQGLVIDDVAYAFNTMTHYAHYQLYLPNEDVRFKVSGNYALSVYEEDQPSKIVLTARFSIYENLLGLQMEVSDITDVDAYQTHQQVSLHVDTKHLTVTYPQTELNVHVYQNQRNDNVAKNLKPSAVAAGIITYDHQPQLVFEAGNEYRRIEFLSHQYAGLNIEKIRFYEPYYHVEVVRDRPRDRRGHQYDEDHNGRFFVRCSGCQAPDYEADYYLVHFTYDSDQLPNGDLYLLSSCYQNRLDSISKIAFYPELNQYQHIALLKQGHYNYQYVFLPHGQSTGRLLYTEGSYYQTENEYVALVYYRPLGGRYDRLVGFATTKNTK